ncbi:MAG: hypothetical protein A3B31_01585 [Candidatus Komeilibacteria bacterium RIFCSPLOWO2_01_FULL_53_11]|uniref:Uncharacterized protein n=1 Tax=Candidatus Komeilibacteria bacterium RIFCSPLOWO2_01_FULL_53_11 TaxID=1798552 RepID=A0A1G2BPF5_9BACT|nr:MAG: hypothetical protein A3B31_01585 [Candidatus Komeilibacteria bacterium RIFCSPLOWO2_01_FULL_53_11]
MFFFKSELFLIKKNPVAETRVSLRGFAAFLSGFPDGGRRLLFVNLMKLPSRVAPRSAWKANVRGAMLHRGRSRRRFIGSE